MLKYNDPDQLRTWIDKTYGKNLSIDIEEFAAGVFRINGIQHVAFDTTYNLTHGHIAHEAKHLVNDAYDQIMAELDKHNDEPECYLLQWYVNTLHKFLNIW